MSGRELPWWREPTRGQWLSLAAAWVGWVLDAFDFTIFLLVMPNIRHEFGVSRTAAAGSITLTLLLRLCGGAAAGAAADRWGRKLPLMISLVWFALCDGAVAFAPSFAWILVLRTLFGFGMGAEWTSGATLAMENWPQRSRGIASGILQGSWAIGYLVAAAVASWVVPRFGWRALFLIAAAPALLVLPIRVWVPESPDYQRARQNDATASNSAAGSGGFGALAQKGVLRRVVWASGAMAFGFGVYYALSGLYPTLLDELGLDAHALAGLVALFNVGMLAGSIGCGVLASRIGVTRAVIVSALVALPILPLYVGAARPLLWLGALLGGAAGVGFAGITPLLLTSLFPAEIRARAVGVVYHVGAFFAAFVPTGIAALSEHGVPLERAILVAAGVCLVGMVAVLLVPIHAPLEKAAGPLKHLPWPRPGSRG
jgi:SHS family lactate transporter-like MFS transporter